MQDVNPSFYPGNCMKTHQQNENKKWHTALYWHWGQNEFKNENCYSSYALHIMLDKNHFPSLAQLFFILGRSLMSPPNHSLLLIGHLIGIETTTDGYI